MAMGGVRVVRRRDGRAVDRRPLFGYVAPARIAHQLATNWQPVSSLRHAACSVNFGHIHPKHSHQKLLRGYPD
jgi:hypothetical protein